MATSTIHDYPKGLTFEQVWAALMENREQQKETDRQMKEADRYHCPYGLEVCTFNLDVCPYGLEVCTSEPDLCPYGLEVCPSEPDVCPYALEVCTYGAKVHNSNIKVHT